MPRLTWLLPSSAGGQGPAACPGSLCLPRAPCLQGCSHACFQIQKADPGVGSAPEGRGEDPAERQAVPGAGLRARGAAQAHRVLRGRPGPARAAPAAHGLRAHAQNHQVNAECSWPRAGCSPKRLHEPSVRLHTSIAVNIFKHLSSRGRSSISEHEVISGGKPTTQTHIKDIYELIGA